MLTKSVVGTADESIMPARDGDTIHSLIGMYEAGLMSPISFERKLRELSQRIPAGRSCAQDIKARVQKGGVKKDSKRL